MCALNALGNFEAIKLRDENTAECLIESYARYYNEETKYSVFHDFLNVTSNRLNTAYDLAVDELGSPPTVGFSNELVPESLFECQQHPDRHLSCQKTWNTICRKLIWLDHFKYKKPDNHELLMDYDVLYERFGMFDIATGIIRYLESLNTDEFQVLKVEY